MKGIEEQIAEIVDHFLKRDYPDFFLYEVRFHEAYQQLEIFIDKDSGMTIDDCSSLVVQIRELLTSYFPSEEPNWIITVSSPGIGSPLKFPRQFKNNIGKYISIISNDSKEWRGKLMNFDMETGEISIQTYQKNKKRLIPKDLKTFQFQNIKQAKIILEI